MELNLVNDKDSCDYLSLKSLLKRVSGCDNAGVGDWPLVGISFTKVTTVYACYPQHAGTTERARGLAGTTG